MTELMRVKARWSGFTGAPGFSVLHFRDFGSDGTGGGSAGPAAALSAASRTRTFFNALGGVLPSSVTITIEPEVDVLEDTTGELLTSFPAGTLQPVAGVGGTNYSAASGAVINWRTNGVRKGRRVRGRTFIVPCAGSVYGPDGSLTGSVRTAIQGAAAGLTDGSATPDLMVYARPSGPAASDGVSYVAQSFTVPSMAAVLRSRRD